MELYAGQAGTQSALVLLALLSVPVLLIPKPAYIYWKHKQTLKHGHKMDDEKSEEVAHDPEGEFNFMEICTQQLIHTLEFVLGAISNSASYLRLWALSLAHGELAIVFWNYFVAGPMKSNTIVIFGGFAVWLNVTLGVIMLMEGMSASLHALRLHWVEFQNKFYMGTGRAFQPFEIDG